MNEVAGLEHYVTEHPFCKGMLPETRHALIDCAHVEQFKAGDYIFRERGPADRFYLLLRGNVALEIHVPGREPIVIDTLTEGDVLGWSWMVPPYQWLTDARVLQLVRAVNVDARCIRGKLETDKPMGIDLFQHFIRVMGRRLEMNRLQLVDMYAQVPEKPDKR